MLPTSHSSFTFLDVFAGIGGVHMGLAAAGGRCVAAVEIDAMARATYRRNIRRHAPHLFASRSTFRKDVRRVAALDLPPADVFAAGFPCQTFSNIGGRRGLEDTRGTLFFEIARLAAEARPGVLLLENVQGIVGHDGGRTLEIILTTLESIGYAATWRIIRASDHGLPQHRPRWWCVAVNRDQFGDTPFCWPTPLRLDDAERRQRLHDVLGAAQDVDGGRTVGLTLRRGGQRVSALDRRRWDCYIVDGVERRLTLPQAFALMGFPEGFSFPPRVSATAALALLGNSVAPPVVAAIGHEIARLFLGFRDDIATRNTALACTDQSLVSAQ